MAGKAINGQRQHADVHQRDGQAAERVLGMEPDEDGLQTIIAEVPLAELNQLYNC